MKLLTEPVSTADLVPGLMKSAYDGDVIVVVISRSLSVTVLFRPSVQSRPVN